MSTYFSRTKALALAAVLALAVTFGLAMATSTAAQADEGDLQAADVQELPAVKVAPLADHGEDAAHEPAQDTPREPTDYGLEIEKTTVANAYTVTFNGKGLEKHYNGEHNEGYWVGMAIPGITGKRFAFGPGYYNPKEANFRYLGTGTESIRNPDGSYSKGGYDDPYFNLGESAEARQYGFVAVAEAEDVEAVTVEGKTVYRLKSNAKAAAVYTLYFTNMKLSYGIATTAAAGGTIAVAEKATEGTEVEVTVTPDPGYELATLTYKNADGEAVDIKASKSFEMPSTDTTVAATFTLSPKVTFVDWDDKVLKEATPYETGTPASDIVQPKTPTRPTDASFAYTFEAWTPELSEVTADVTYKATYKKTPLFKVMFVDEDGKTVLKEATAYPEGTKAADIVQPDKPTKPADPSCTYDFAGWSPELSDVTKDAIYTATYKKTPIPAAEPDRLQGNVALDTMAAIVKEGWSGMQGGAIVLTTVDGYWDALTAAGIAGLVRAPVLMTDGGTLSAQTKSVISSLKPGIIIVCGGTSAVTDDAVDQAREASGIKPLIIRCWGQTATDTAIDVYKKGPLEHLGVWPSSVFLCTNDGYWDALAAAPISYAKHMPIFLTEGRSSISDETISAMKSGGVENVYIVGGSAAIDEAVEQRLADAGINVAKRLWGETAVETSEAVATFGLEQGMTCVKMGVATTNGYWDALAGAPLCGLNNSVIVLAENAQSHSISNFIANHKEDVSQCYIYGGEAAIDASTYNAIKSALDRTV